MKRVTLVILISFIGSWSWCNDSLFQRGVEDLAMQNFHDAQKVFEKDVLNRPTFASFYNLGVASGELKEWSKARWAFESALKYKPRDSNAQYNAKFVVHKLGENKEWTHPYSWLNRLILGFGSLTWIVLSIVSSVFLSVVIYRFLSDQNIKPNYRKWYFRLTIPAVILLGMSSYFALNISNHFKKPQYLILRNNNTSFFLSPNGVESGILSKNGTRLPIVNFLEDSSWFQVKLDDNNLLWVKHNDVFPY